MESGFINTYTHQGGIGVLPACEDSHSTKGMALCNFSGGRGNQVHTYIHITEASNETSLWQPMKSSQQHRKTVFRLLSK